MQPQKETLDRLVERIKATAHPIRIVLFGSAARGEMGSHSDLDILVVVEDGSACRKIAGDLYVALAGLGYSKDIVVATPSIIREHGDNPYMVYYDAMRRGKELYNAAA